MFVSIRYVNWNKKSCKKSPWTDFNEIRVLDSNHHTQSYNNKNIVKRSLKVLFWKLQHYETACHFITSYQNILEIIN